MKPNETQAPRAENIAWNKLELPHFGPTTTARCFTDRLKRSERNEGRRPEALVLRQQLTLKGKTADLNYPVTLSEQIRGNLLRTTPLKRHLDI